MGAFSAVFFDVYFLESLQILMIVTMILITVTTILTRDIAISITKVTLLKISHKHTSQTPESSRINPAKSQPPTENGSTYFILANISSNSNIFFYTI